MLVYATPAQLATWTGQPEPDNATILLREASILVASACRCDVYDTIPSGLPADDDLVEAMMQATCAHAAQWDRLGIDPAAGPGGLPEKITASSIDGASVSTNAGELAAEAARSLDTLCPSAYRILRLAGLASSAVQSW
ncbi:hypothetical protein [Rhodococcus sp. UNC363MFTsu5.1]|uniref:hypothetical protein n=1 Tax=Rhodococcus sp. UNC363MFTsu5.1 TaxID=1449069 RepID=UPI000480DC1F|nr:hypothetical protein [Rhodococcus sp. UNC363MFTsu5.1]